MGKDGQFLSERKGLQYSLKDRKQKTDVLVCFLVFCSVCCLVFWIRRFTLFDVCELSVS